MKKIAFYIMNSKGYFVFEKFINKFGSDSISYVVSSEDKNIQKDFFVEIKELAKKEKIKFFERFEDIANIEKDFSGYKFTIGWRWLIKDERNLIVFHDSLLPKYRGFAPLVNCLVNNENQIGVTALFASSEYDRGDIIAQRSLEINYPIKINKAIQNIEPLYFELVDEIYLKIQKCYELKAIKQDENKATYSLWLDSEDYFIDWSWSAQDIKRFVDAVGYPYDNAKAYLNGEIVKFVDIEIVKDVVVENRVRHIGKVIFIKNGMPLIVCSDGIIGLKDIRSIDGSKLLINFRSKFK
ncbi:formyltransferase family protein [Aliarcobacter butzleri]|uniref:formyltransferase family protein n=1 Tax=Aliarcobacter butzleri TaxID=28197 RepID=UPI00125EFD71|nr:formyltransferase family protein [Aliarcobacter butzleri]